MKTDAERKREQRERDRSEGLYLVNAAHGKAQPGKTMCVQCQDATYERVKASRARAKGNRENVRAKTR